MFSISQFGRGRLYRRSPWRFFGWRAALELLGMPLFRVPHSVKTPGRKDEMS